VSGCSPYLESLPSYIDGAPPWTPTNRGYGITSRSLKHDLEVSPYVLTTYQTYTNSQVIDTYIMHRNFIPTSVTNLHLSHVESVPTRYYQPWVKCLFPYQYHATRLPTINVHRCSCQICDHIYIQPLMYSSYKDHAKLTIHHM